jgi:hypothetical protein
MSTTNPQTQGDESPKICPRPLSVLKKHRVKLKNYLYYLFYQTVSGGTWSILDWLLANESCYYLRLSDPWLYSITTLLLLELRVKDKTSSQQGHYYFVKEPKWFAQNLLRAINGIGKDRKIQQDLLAVSTEFEQLSQELVRGNIVLLEAGVCEDKRSFTIPERHRGYDDHGTSVPDHKKGRVIEDSKSPDPEEIRLGKSLDADLEILDILGPIELQYFFLREKEKMNRI